MLGNDEQKMILEQYRIYCESKEKFIDRQFATNRFYLIMNILILISMYILTTLFPQQHPVLILALIGMAISIMWLMSIDTYQALIKVKYAKVIEYLETKLPEQPNHKEYVDYTEMKRRKNLIVFGDMQKILTWVILIIYIVTCTMSLHGMIKYQTF